MSSPKSESPQEFYQKLVVYIGADHRGRFVRDVVISVLDDFSIEWKDVSKLEEDSADDYPDFAEPVAQSVAYQEYALGILICGTGHGMCIAANKIAGVRATVCHSSEEAALARSHNHINVLCLAANTVEPTLLVGIIRSFLDTIPSKEVRHLRRLNKIERIEKDNFKDTH